MRRVVLMLIASLGLYTLGACAGAQIPQHNGYKKGDKAKPWTSAKTLKFDEKTNEAKAEGALDYKDFRRAKWFAVDLAQHGDLDLQLEITPPGDGVNEDFDLAFEVLDPGNRVISKWDLEDEGAGELNKKKGLKDLTPGKYLIHVYLQGRMDSADFVLRAVYKPTGANNVKTDFPAQVIFTPALAMVPLSDDTPAKYHPPVTTAIVTIKKGPKPPPGTGTKPPPPPPPSTSVSARIVAVNVVGGGTQITVGRGTDTGAAVGMKVSLKGISGTLAACNARTCTAVLTATPDQIKSAGGEVTLSP